MFLIFLKNYKSNNTPNFKKYIQYQNFIIYNKLLKLNILIYNLYLFIFYIIFNFYFKML